uniref:Uncharacterized protein n=1 Tax=Lactuca sativa TaxID=4236 RepID=A0A9R1VSG8_LACSA|nr:hypothetical protein LSAT_V11C400176670 [Lactuca sativa]
MSSSSSFDSTVQKETLFFGFVIAKIVASRLQPKTRKPQLRRNCVAGHKHLTEDCFADDVVCAAKFRQRFRMGKELFLRVVGDLEYRFSYFQWKQDARHKKCFFLIQKCISACRQT